MPGRGRDRGYKGPKKKVATPKLSSQPDVRRGRGYQPATVNDARRGRGYKPATPTMYTRFGVAPTATSPFARRNIQVPQNQELVPGAKPMTAWDMFNLSKLGEYGQVAMTNPQYASMWKNQLSTYSPSNTSRYRGRASSFGVGEGTTAITPSDYWLQSPGFLTPMRGEGGGIIGTTGFGPFGPPVPEAQGMVASPPPEVPTEPYVENGGYGYGYGGYGGGGGGGGDYTYPTYSNPFSQYQPGYAAQSSPGQAQMGMRAVQPGNQYKPYATQNQAARWLQLLTNWRIG